MCGPQYKMKFFFCFRQEKHNPHDYYDIAALKQQQVVVHFPKEISQFTWFIINHGAAVSMKVVDINYRRSPLVQGGLEIPIEVCVVMPLSDANKRVLDTYMTLNNEIYEGPVNGNFPEVTAQLLLIFIHRLSQRQKTRKNNRRQL